jgi:hypothetical protein
MVYKVPTHLASAGSRCRLFCFGRGMTKDLHVPFKDQLLRMPGSLCLPKPDLGRDFQGFPVLLVTTCSKTSTSPSLPT